MKSTTAKRIKCSACGKSIKVANFGAVAVIDGKHEFYHDGIVCLVKLSRKKKI